MRAVVIGHVEWIDFIRVESVPKPGEQNQRRDGQEFEEEDHVIAPSGGRLGMTSSSKRIYAAV